jgi:hypothetical protein
VFRAQASRAVGGNGRRTSHNPPDPAMLDIYDRIGVTVMRRAANHKGSWGLCEFWLSGPLGTPARTRWVLSRLEKWHTKRARTSARTFGSPVRRTAAHWVSDGPCR